MSADTNRLSIDVWSDIACPWCHVGKRRLEAALARFPHRDRVDVRWRSFELDPTAPRVLEPGVPYADRLARKYGASRANAESMIATMTATAAGEGLDFRFDRIRPGNTFDAHRLVHLAHETGRGDALKERLFVAYLSEGEAIGDPAVLARLAADVGLEVAAVERVLGGDAYADDVRADEARARALGVGGVPFFRIGPDLGASGAPPPEVLLEQLNRAWERAGGPATAGEGSACGPAGCD